MTSMANLLKENEAANGGSADPKAAVPVKEGPDLLNTFDTLPDEDEQIVQRQYPRS